MAKEEVLKSIKKEAVAIVEKHIPNEFFKNREGLFVWSSFISNVVSKAKETESGAKFNLSSFELTKDATDEEIEKDLPKDHIFSETDVCAIVADLIEKQSKGEEGILLNSGYANLFYTPSHVVHVLWSGGEWSVDVWFRGASGWFVGFRVFSPATES